MESNLKPARTVITVGEKSFCLCTSLKGKSDFPGSCFTQKGVSSPQGLLCLFQAYEQLGHAKAIWMAPASLWYQIPCPQHFNLCCKYVNNDATVCAVTEEVFVLLSLRKGSFLLS